MDNNYTHGGAKHLLRLTVLAGHGRPPFFDSTRTFLNLSAFPMPQVTLQEDQSVQFERTQSTGKSSTLLDITFDSTMGLCVEGLLCSKNINF